MEKMFLSAFTGLRLAETANRELMYAEIIPVGVKMIDNEMFTIKHFPKGEISLLILCSALGSTSQE